MFKELTDKIQYSELELSILKFWKERNIFEKSVSTRDGKPGFTFYEGPPTANGRPGIHHVMSRTLKDLICRYKTMRGFQVHRKAGWDTHGLPVEIEVEKSLGFKHKDDIVKYGVAKFNEECKKSVWKYKTEWEQLTERMGYWVDMNDPYVTFENNYIESVWWALKQYFDKGFIYKGYKIQPYCPRCETPLSSHEVSLGYETIKGPSVYVKFKLKSVQSKTKLNDPSGGPGYILTDRTHYLLVWTTTPWTLISNVALAVNEEVEYVIVEFKGERYILAKKALDDPEFHDLMSEGRIFDWEGLGGELVGLEYEPLFKTNANQAWIPKITDEYFITPTAQGALIVQQNLGLSESINKAYIRISKEKKEIYNDSLLVVVRQGKELALIPFIIWVKMDPIPDKVRTLVGFPIMENLLVPNKISSPDNILSVKGPQAFFVVGADFVITEEGSGIVHMAPAYGDDDYQTSKKYGLPTIHPVTKSGTFGPEVTDFAGQDVWDAGKDILKSLESRGLLYRQKNKTIGEILKDHEHSYPHCWRCKTKLLQYARDSWYIATTKYAKRMVELNNQIHWYPPEVGSGRFGNWLEENKDWSLSRDRFWGTPLPIWICEKCGKQTCVGSIEEFRKGKGVKDPLDLHKPFVDDVTFDCACGGTMRRVPELIDVWFDSGAMQFAQWHYPFEHKDLIDSGEQHPADYICEGVDQTRGWFYSLHSISTFLFDEPAFKNVIVNELILDKEGQKMSKSKGNTVDPFTILQKYGADTTRWYLVATSPPWRTTLFDEDGMVEVQRKFLGTLLNTYAFFSLYANIDKFEYNEKKIPVAQRQEIDRWIISALNSLVKTYTEAMDSYDVTKAARAVSDFTIDQLSNWYVRRNRRRFWKSEMGGDKLAAYQTLYKCLVVITKLMAPFAPFLAEELYGNLNSIAKQEQTDSVHLAMMPEVEAAALNLELESKMEKAQRIVSLVRAIRNKSNLKVRQPLSRVIIPVSGERDQKAIAQMEEVILEEINVKKLEFVTDDSGIVHKSAKPNFKTLGPKHGKSVQAVAAAIKNFGAKEITSLEKEGQLAIPVNGSDVMIMKEDVEILHQDIKGWIVESDGTLTVALDTELTPALIDEGFAREFVNRIQNMRKDAGFEVTDRIRIQYSSDKKLSDALKTLVEYVKHETLATDVTEASGMQGYAADLDINGERCSVSIERVTKNGK